MVEPAKILASNDLGVLPEWDLSDLYNSPDDPNFKCDISFAEKSVKLFKEKYQGHLINIANDGAKLAEVIKGYEQLTDLLGKLSSYAGLYYYANQSDSLRSKFFGDTNDALTRLGTELIFFELELNKIDQSLLDKQAQRSVLLRYKPWLDDLRREKPYQLEENLERLFTEKSQTSRSAFSRLFNETMSRLRFDVEGEADPVGLEPALHLLSDQSSRRRKAAACALEKGFKQNLPLFTFITNTLAKDKEISDRWRGFKDIADSRHLANRVEAPVVDALVEAVRASYPALSHRYYKMKARWLGLEKIPYWDRNAPLPDKPESIYTWEVARRIVLKAFEQFSLELSKIANEFFVKNWIDAPIRVGKASGAFSASTVPSVHPYILLNYQGKPRDVMTLSHELGHGVHQMLARVQGPLLAQTPLTLAETASVFSEMLTFQLMIAETKSIREKKAMIASKVEDMLNTVVRQVAFYSFERKVHEGRRQGELTAEQINTYWMEVQKESLGPAFDLQSGYEVYWTYISHFINSPFYVYAYAFGDCLVNSLYSIYKEGHPGFEEKYISMLTAGGSKHHSKLLAPFGLDATDKNFWSKGLKVIEGMINELEDMDKIV
ncbi:MAG: M3 family oligoendopeptidase [Hyphomicrobium sp.]